MADPGALGRFWARAHGIPEEHWSDSCAAADPGGTAPPLSQRSPAGKVAEHRVRLDVNAGKGMVSFTPVLWRPWR
ncbi:hypothetical protein GCM10022247_41100 [Allokutzneria multivorans]|uniref:Glyoxalase-like domain-containing protein n=1 Tax=Allokutzneria multivorans TaxID=1142134 RepID=A0ABP7SN13_9PSEU